MALSSKLTIRIIFCAVLALLIMAITMLTLMVLFHHSDFKLIVSGMETNCCYTCPECGNKISILNSNKK